MTMFKVIPALVLAMGVSVAALAQPAVPLATASHAPAGPSAVGRWLYNEQGDTIGSVRSLADGGQTAVIMIGNYLRPGSYEARIPASNLLMVNNKVVLQPETVLALNTPSHR